MSNVTVTPTNRIILGVVGALILIAVIIFMIVRKRAGKKIVQGFFGLIILAIVILVGVSLLLAAIFSKSPQ